MKEQQKNLRGRTILQKPSEEKQEEVAARAIRREERGAKLDGFGEGLEEGGEERARAARRPDGDRERDRESSGWELERRTHKDAPFTACFRVLVSFCGFDAIFAHPHRNRTAIETRQKPASRRPAHVRAKRRLEAQSAWRHGRCDGDCSMLLCAWSVGGKCSSISMMIYLGHGTGGGHARNGSSRAPPRCFARFAVGERRASTCPLQPRFGFSSTAVH